MGLLEGSPSGGEGGVDAVEHDEKDRVVCFDVLKARRKLPGPPIQLSQFSKIWHLGEPSTPALTGAAIPSISSRAALADGGGTFHGLSCRGPRVRRAMGRDLPGTWVCCARHLPRTQTLANHDRQPRAPLLSSLPAPSPSPRQRPQLTRRCAPTPPPAPAAILVRPRVAGFIVGRALFDDAAAARSERGRVPGGRA